MLNSMGFGDLDEDFFFDELDGDSEGRGKSPLADSGSADQSAALVVNPVKKKPGSKIGVEPVRSAKPKAKKQAVKKKASPVATAKQAPPVESKKEVAEAVFFESAQPKIPIETVVAPATFAAPDAQAPNAFMAPAVEKVSDGGGAQAPSAFVAPMAAASLPAASEVPSAFMAPVGRTEAPSAFVAPSAATAAAPQMPGVFVTPAEEPAAAVVSESAATESATFITPASPTPSQTAPSGFGLPMGGSNAATFPNKGEDDGMAHFNQAIPMASDLDSKEFDSPFTSSAINSAASGVVLEENSEPVTAFSSAPSADITAPLTAEDAAGMPFQLNDAGATVTLPAQAASDTGPVFEKFEPNSSRVIEIGSATGTREVFGGLPAAEAEAYLGLPFDDMPDAEGQEASVATSKALVASPFIPAEDEEDSIDVDALQTNEQTVENTELPLEQATVEPTTAEVVSEAQLEVNEFVQALLDSKPQTVEKADRRRLSNRDICLLIVLIGAVSGAGAAAFFIPTDALVEQLMQLLQKFTGGVDAG